MFVGRTAELEQLNRLYNKRGFQMMVLYGRRRIGKTTLIDQFVTDKPTLYFTAKQQSNLLNLNAFSRKVIEFFHLPPASPMFASWDDALAVVAQHAQANTIGKPFVFVFDEFPYAALADQSLPSTLQITIDHGFGDTDVTMILSGSNEGFMESQVLGYQSPLYGRRTAQLRLRPFDYADAALLMPNATAQDRINYYATFGGTPYYLAQIDDSLSYRDNMMDLCFNPSGLLFEEPLMLLRQELREPALYNSILQAIANGASTIKLIAEHSGVEYHSITKYLKTLENLFLIERQVPFGEQPTKSRKARYIIRDPFFAYWYRFVSNRTELVESGYGKEAAQQAFGPAFDTYVGQQFETVCRQWLMRANHREALPFLATHFGKWWGNDPVAREETDIDVIAANPDTREILVGECKWRSSLNIADTIATLRSRAGLVRGYDRHHLALFVKTDELARVARERHEPNLTVVAADEMFE